MALRSFSSLCQPGTYFILEMLIFVQRYWFDWYVVASALRMRSDSNFRDVNKNRNVRTGKHQTVVQPFETMCQRYWQLRTPRSEKTHQIVELGLACIQARGKRGIALLQLIDSWRKDWPLAFRTTAMLVFDWVTSYCPLCSLVISFQAITFVRPCVQLHVHVCLSRP